MQLNAIVGKKWKMDFGFVRCLKFSNYLKLLHVVRLSFACAAISYGLSWHFYLTLKYLSAPVFLNSNDLQTYLCM